MEISDPVATFAAYKNNEIDATGGVQVAATDIAAARNDPATRDQVGETVELSESWLQFNVTKKPFDNKLLRQAIGFAIDRGTLVDKVLGGAAVPATSLIPPGMPGYIEDTDPAHGYDVNKARQLLAQAGFPNGQGLPADIPMAYNNLSVIPQIMQLIQNNLSAIGISVQLEPRDSNSYFAGLRQDAPPLFRTGWNADYPDPNDWYRVIFETGAGPNYGHWSNADFDQVVAAAARETSPAKRDDLYKKAAQIMAGDPPGAWWYYNRRFRLVKPWVKGLVTTAQDGGFAGKYFIKDITISS
jgi:oligopeptide transport system substrate-binding protein